jgi:hypothetical protein
MRALAIFTIILFIVCRPGLLSAENPSDDNRFNLGFYTGPTLPIGSERLTEYWGIGFITGFQTGYFITENIRLGAEIDYSAYSFRRSRFREENNFPEEQFKITNNTSSTMLLAATATYFFALRPDMRIFAGVNGGMMYVTIGDILVGEEGADLTVTGSNKSGFAGGVFGGLEMWFWPATSLFSELGYRYGHTPRTSTRYMPLKLGVNVYL